MRRTAERQSKRLTVARRAENPKVAVPTTERRRGRGEPMSLYARDDVVERIANHEEGVGFPVGLETYARSLTPYTQS